LAQLADVTIAETDEPDTSSPLSSDTMSAHAQAFVVDLVGRGLAGPDSRVLSLASHGGHLTAFLAERGIGSIVVESLAGRAQRLSTARHGVVLATPDQADFAARVEPGRFDLVLDNYLLAHLEQPGVALANMVALLAPGGTLVLEFDHLLATVQGGQWDAIRHGHHTYLALGWVAHQLKECGLTVVDATPQPVYGGALRVFARATGPQSAEVAAILAAETQAAIDRPDGLLPVRDAVERARIEVRAHLEQARDSGQRVLGYGAPARSVTFLNALDIGPDLLPFVVDRSTVKQGRVIPGTRIPIRSPAVLADGPPDELLILTWDLAAEVLGALRPVLPRTRFIVAVPRLAEITDTGDLVSGWPSADAPP
jgi:SAM-dependent methyltransferase